MKLLFLTSNIRAEEKLLLQATERAGLEFLQVDVRQKVFDHTKENIIDPYLVINRCIGQTQALGSIRYYESLGLTCVNCSHTISLCGDKQAMTLALQAANLPTPKTVFAMGRASAMRAIQEMGFPVVIKPTTGSWGRMVVRANDLTAAEAILDLRENLTGPQHRLHYIQRLVDTGNSDIRVIMLDDHILTAFRRISDHWITNAARGARGEKIEVSHTLAKLCRATSNVAGGGILSIDVFETEREGYLINEVNHTTEFMLAMTVTQLDIAGSIIDYLKVKLAS
ncbi:MAG: RimK family alpha-L-glutamate ligase [Microlunatus sp.]